MCCFFFSEGTKKLTNKATLWYVPLSLKNVDKVLEVPPVVVRRPPSTSLWGQMAEAWSSATQTSLESRRGWAPACQQEMPVEGVSLPGIFPDGNVSEGWPRAARCPSWRTLPRAPDRRRGGGQDGVG